MFEWNEFDNGEWDTDEDKPVHENEPVIISRQVAWVCACGEHNFTDWKDMLDRAICAECGQQYSWLHIANQHGTYEQTLDSDGNADFDAFIPDYPDDENEPEPPDEPEENTAG